MAHKKQIILHLLISSIIILIIFYVGYIPNMKSEISENVLRLHIIGADNTQHAQTLKLKVRDRILADFSGIFMESNSPKDALRLAMLHKSDIENSAKDELKNNNCSDDISVEIGFCRFPTKVYDDITLPKGRYTAVNIKIGKAEGKNWWCVMYPPLCINENVVSLPDKSKEKLRQTLTEEEYELITKSTAPDIKVKFRIAEILGNIF